MSSLTNTLFLKELKYCGLTFGFSTVTFVPVNTGGATVLPTRKPTPFSIAASTPSLHNVVRETIRTKSVGLTGNVLNLSPAK